MMGIHRTKTPRFFYLTPRPPRRPPVVAAWTNEEVTDDERKARIQMFTEAERKEAQASM